ncbi:MAG: hypothetical protein M1820_001187 [Bogoriella megaspora]|nr:MAG: hypothetical protein M1820_001187 [Bogoriella megaspora]
MSNDGRNPQNQKSSVNGNGHQKEAKRADAGMRALDHYKNKLPRWRYRLRQALIPIVRWETPYLAYAQKKLGSPALDSYFALAANLGTHTFFMIMLPILFWCGFTTLGRAMVNMLAFGVFWSGFIKDMICLPRPLSPPLKRITMSGSAALEYGFPSTHSTNAVSVAMYALVNLQQQPPSQFRSVMEYFSCFYAISIIIGRLYCGMHGFFDVIIGSALGALLTMLQTSYSDTLELWLFDGPLQNPLIAILVLLVLVRIHPEPADDCPCFDDSVAFAGVVMGVTFGSWHYERSGFAWSNVAPAFVPFNFETLGLLKAAIRIILGVFLIFAWRGVMKPALLAFLPPVFRVIEQLGLTLPRKFFMRASQYKTVPALRKDDNVIPPASSIPTLITSLRHPRRRAVSVGPQSEADAYETMAYREKRRRESLSSTGAGKSPDSLRPKLLTDNESTTLPSYQQTIHDDDVIESPLDAPTVVISSSEVNDDQFSGDRASDHKELFANLEKPRVRYDVEVVTKLIIYSGIAWIAVEGAPCLFEVCGLGVL